MQRVNSSETLLTRSCAILRKTLCLFTKAKTWSKKSHRWFILENLNYLYYIMFITNISFNVTALCTFSELQFQMKQGEKENDTTILKAVSHYDVQNVGCSACVDGVTFNTTHKIYTTLKTKIKQIWQLHLIWNMTHSNRYCLHTRYDVHKHTGEHNVLNLKINLIYIKLKSRTAVQM